MATRVLVLDRHRADRKAVIALLKQEGFEVVEASTAPVEQLSEQANAEVDLILADLLSSEIGPANLVRLVRSRWPGVPLVAISRTGRIHHIYYAELMSYFGADAFLDKPIDRMALLRVIGRFAPL
jgi:CheY-like chemotaxis protein